MRTTPENITQLEKNQVFVFGSNEAGIHGAGAARTALQWGAEMGYHEGLSGQTYAIPTKDRTISRTLSTEKIGLYVDRFISFAQSKPNLTFLVTQIGCGLAGHKPENIAPLFANAIPVLNIWLPDDFWTELQGEIKWKQ